MYDKKLIYKKKLDKRIHKKREETRIIQIIIGVESKDIYSNFW